MDRTTLIILAIFTLMITGLFGNLIAEELGIGGTEIDVGWWDVELPTEICAVCFLTFFVLIVLALLFARRRYYYG